MPRAAKASRPDIKPYGRVAPLRSQDQLRMEDQEELDAANRADRAANSPSKASRKWSSDELLQLFEHVAKNGTSSGNKGWAEAVPGRTANQSYQTWLQSLGPYIRKAIVAKK